MSLHLGHSAIVVGATSGMGAAMTLHLTEHGPNVTLVGRPISARTTRWKPLRPLPATPVGSDSGK